MKTSHLRDLLLLSALWGASFLFMRITAPEFGPVPMAALRVAGATLLLLPLLAWRGELAALRAHWRRLLVVGVTNSALPFALFGYAALHLTGGLAAIFNAATPLCGALIAWAWLHEHLSRWRIAGLALGFVGVAGLALVKAGATEVSWAVTVSAAHAEPGAGAAGFTLGGLAMGGPALAVAACLLAPMFYGFAACYTRRFLLGVPSMAVATGSQLFAALALAIPAAISWPAQSPSAHAWAMLAVLATACTGLAYILYFRLIAGAGAAFAMTVTYLVPAFAVVWGAIFIGEQLTAAMLLGCAVILTGTALATGLLPRTTARPNAGLHG